MSGQDRIYEMVNDRILAALERGVVPWRKPWNAANPFTHQNAATGRLYRGVNVFLLAVRQQAHGYPTARWLTFHQARERGGTVKAGERGTPVVFWKILEREETDDLGEVETTNVPLLRYYTVFNVAQTTGIPDDRLVPAEPPRQAFDPLEAAERIADGYPDGPRILHGATMAYWRPSTDEVHLPERAAFESRHAYYATLFHELAHSTGHERRLKRNLSGTGHFGSALYGQEELVAEMGSAFLQATAGIQDQFEASAAYLDNWMKAIHADRRLLVVASARAQHAANWVLGIRKPPKAQPAAPTAPVASAEASA